MLVLSRKQGERILIGDDIVIEVVRTSNSDVRLGITAPDDVPILRDELSEAKECSAPNATTTTSATYQTASVSRADGT